MPQPYKGKRIAVTARLPIGLYEAVAEAARRNRWTVNEFMVAAAERATGNTSQRAVKHPSAPPIAPIRTDHLVSDVG